MFGDPITNDKGWEALLLGNALNIHPKNGLYKHQSKYGNGTKIIRIDSFYDGYVEDIETLKRVELTRSEVDQYLVKKDDILINRVNSMEYLGKIGIVPDIAEDIVYESNMMRFRLNEEHIIPIFLMNLWRTNFIKEQIARRAKHAVNQSSINQPDVLSFTVLSPPIQLQNQFATIVTKIEEQKALVKQSIQETQTLFDSLMSQYFD
nr:MULTISPECIES: restriction endonuclease subunit S [Paenibacillus]